MIFQFIIAIIYKWKQLTIIQKYILGLFLKIPVSLHLYQRDQIA